MRIHRDGWGTIAAIWAVCLGIIAICTYFIHIVWVSVAISVILAFLMCFSVLHIPGIGTRVVAEETDEVIEEVTEETVEKAQPTVYRAVLDEVTVIATVAEGTFTEEVVLVVEPILTDSAEYQKADDTLKESGASYDGMMAFDIYFKVVGTGEKIEPEDERTGQ